MTADDVLALPREKASNVDSVWLRRSRTAM